MISARRRIFFLAFVGFVISASFAVFAQERKVAITVDDLPYAGMSLVASNPSDLEHTAAMVNRSLLIAFQKHRIPVTGFVIQKTAESLRATGAKILEEWTDRGFDLGSHTYSHPDINRLSVDEIEQEVVRGELAIEPLMKKAGKQLAFFRFPMNHTGDTREKHDALVAYLSQRGYRLATCTIDNSDYVFNAAYVRMLANKDDASAQKLRAEYIAYTESEIDYYSGLNKQVLGYEPPHVMLLHDNLLNADVIEQVLHIFEKKQYRFVSLDEAQADDAYRSPDTYITKFGPMWGYRWAAGRKIKVDGTLEPDPPNWIVDYGKAARSACGAVCRRWT
jgi:peptidoglycan/xylan/chitin deacetylase (PgdA/CDA1 family)